MTFGFENKNEYVQPSCKVYQVHVQQMIASSGQAQTEPLEEEDFEW